MSQGGSTRPDAPAEAALERIPWHFWLLLGAAAVYLAWRAVQGVALLLALPGVAAVGLAANLGSFGLWRSLVSASVWGTEGREFKSPQPDKQKPRSEHTSDLGLPVDNYPLRPNF